MVTRARISGNKSDEFEKGIAKRNANAATPFVGGPIGPDRLCIGKQRLAIAHAVLETQESIGCSIEPSEHTPHGFLLLLRFASIFSVPVFSWPTFRDFSPAKNTI